MLKVLGRTLVDLGVLKEGEAGCMGVDKGYYIGFYSYGRYLRGLWRVLYSDLYSDLLGGAASVVLAALSLWTSFLVLVCYLRL